MKWLNKKWIVLAAAAALSMAAVPVYAQSNASAPSNTPSLQENEQTAREQLERGHEHSKAARDHKAYRMKRLKEAADYFGISTEGKSAKQLHKELKAAREADSAKWDRFKAEQKAKRLARLQEVAKGLGIETQGKNAQQLRKEIRAACKEKREAEVR
jgi:hypothetical protein